MTVHSGIKNEMLAIFNKNKKELFSVSDIEGITKFTKRAIDNCLRQLRIAGFIYRHKEKDVNHDYQFAVSLAEKDIDPYAPIKPQIKKKGILSVKEIRSMFQAQYNNMARLEDVIMRSLEEFELIEKEMERIKNVVRRK